MYLNLKYSAFQGFLLRKHMYWENSSNIRNYLVWRSPDGFRYVIRNIHCCHSNNFDPGHKLTIVWPLMYIRNEKSYNLHLLKNYGRYSTKQFIKRWGYKLWTETTRFGYIEWVDQYRVSWFIIPDKYNNIRPRSFVVFEFADELQKHLPNLPFYIRFENFSISLTLFQ